MLEEYRLLHRLGLTDVQLWDKDRVHATRGAGENFIAGLFYPRDAIIDSPAYAQCVLDAAVATGRVSLRTGCPRVTTVVQRGAVVEVTLADGSVLTARSACVWALCRPVISLSRATSAWRCGQQCPHACSQYSLIGVARVMVIVVVLAFLWCCRHVVMATGGLFLDPALAGVMQPSWSYLFGVPDDGEPTDRDGTPYSSPNFFSFGFGVDWCITGGMWRCSGEDHFSALKAPRPHERCAALAKWSVQQMPSLAPAIAAGRVETQYGVTSETPDYVPIVGTPTPASRVCYLLGCNALGQSILSYAATLVPGILGFAPLTDVQQKRLELMSIRRFALLPVVRGDSTPTAKL